MNKPGPTPHQMLAYGPLSWLTTEGLSHAAQEAVARAEEATAFAAAVHLAAAARHLLNITPDAQWVSFVAYRYEDDQAVDSVSLRGLKDQHGAYLWEPVYPSAEQFARDSDFEFAEAQIAAAMRLFRTHYSYPHLEHMGGHVFRLRLR